LYIVIYREEASSFKRRYGQFHLYLDEDILARVKELARKEGRTTAELVREGMADLLQKKGRI
jgi:predicted DNA-binding protein